MTVMEKAMTEEKELRYITFQKRFDGPQKLFGVNIGVDTNDQTMTFILSFWSWQLFIGPHLSTKREVSRKDYLVLEILGYDKEKYGLEIVEESEGRLGLSGIYSHLHRMEKRGLITSRNEEDPSVYRQRRLYKRAKEKSRG